MKIRQASEADTTEIAHVQVDSWRTTYTGIVPEVHLVNLSYEQREAMWRINLADPERWVYVAENDEGKIVGFSSGGPERSGHLIYKGELYAIYLLADYQRKGIGTELARANARKLSQNHFNTMLVWVLAKNPFRRFYEALGGKELNQKEIVIGDTPLIEVAYGWKPLDRLLEEVKGTS